MLAQKTIHVPADQPTIQAGINAANNGDTVLVAPGTYYENINFNGKAIALSSSGGAATTIIDGGLLNPVVSLGTSTSAPAVLNGFTIQRGVPAQSSQFSQLGGGVIVVGSATVENNTVTANESCGIDIATFGIIVIQANHVFDNGFVSTPGNSSGCHIDGSGIDFILAISSNFPSPQATITGNLVEGNAGAGVSGDFEANTMAILDNTVRNNDGGGITVISLYGPGVIAGNLIYGNLGIGLQAEFNVPSTLSILNNTLYQNGGSSTNNSLTASELLVDGGAVQVVNNIIVHTNAAQEPTVACNKDFASPLPVAFDHNDIYNPSGPLAISSYLVTGYGNRAEDPLFANAGAGNFQLLPSSPEIDSGNNSAATLPATDIAGNPRIMDATSKGYPIVDMGAYEASGVQEYSPTIASLTPCTTTPQIGSNLLLTAVLSSPLGTPSGAASLFMDLGSSPLATATLDASGRATFTVPTISSGLHSFAVSYSGTRPFTPATSVVVYVDAQSSPSTCTQPAASTTTALASSLNPATFGQSVTFTATVTASSVGSAPTGSVTFTDGTTTLNTATLVANGTNAATTSVASSAMAVGSHGITATYVPTGNFAASTAALTEVINPLASTTTLTAAPNPAFAGQAVMLTAAVSGASSTPTGSVTFYDGTASLGSAQLDATGHTSLTTSTLAVGIHSLTVSYAGSTIYAASTSAPFPETIQPNPANFTISLANPNISIRTQHHATTSVTLTSLNGFTDSLKITCANLPQYVTCQATPASAPLGANATATASLYIDTDSVIGYAQLARPHTPGGMASWALLLWPVSLAGCVAGLRRKRFRLVLAAIAGIALTAGLTGCGTIIVPVEVPPSAAPGTYVLPITATGASTGIAHTVNLMLTVTP